MNIGGPGLAQGILGFLQMQRQNAMQDETMKQLQARGGFDQWQRQQTMDQYGQQQRAQQSAGDVMRQFMLGGGPQGGPGGPMGTPTGIPPMPGSPQGGPMPPGPGVSSQPSMPPPGGPIQPQGAMQGPQPGGAIPPMGGGPGGPMMGPQGAPGPAAAPPMPQPIPPYRTIPDAPPQGPQMPPAAVGAIPPAPAAPAAAPQQQPPQFTFENVAQAFSAQGLQGADLWRALNEVAPRLDVTFRQQVQQLNQEIALLKTQSAMQDRTARGEDRSRALDVREREQDRRENAAPKRSPFAQELVDAGIKEGSPQWNKAWEKRVARETAPTATQVNLAQGSGGFDKDDIAYWAGVLQNGGSLPPRLATTPGGKQLVADIMKATTRSGVDPKTMLSNQAEFMGEKAGQRTLGTRTANIEMAGTEADKLADLALTASGKVARTGMKSLNSAIQAVEKGTASPELRAFVAANTSFINAYARAINPQGVGTVADKEHAREMLDTAFSKGDYTAVIKQLKQEIGAARASPGSVRGEMRERFTGKPDARGNAAPAAADVFGQADAILQGR